MGLRGQAGGQREQGYAMAALLIMLAVMAILMTVAMPVWRHEVQREKEAELVFRGEQYARAIALYRSKNQQLNAFPPSIDVLVEGRYLRKKYKDPMTKDGEFVPILAATQAGPGPQNPQTPPPPTTPQGRGQTPQQPGARGGPGSSTVAIGGIRGVRSKSTENSIRSFRGATRYDQWAFTFDIVQRPGGGVQPGNPGEGGNDGRSGRGGRGNGIGGSNPGSGTGTGQTPFPGSGSGSGQRPGRGFGPGSGGTPGSPIGPGSNFPPMQPPPQGGRPGGPGRGGGQ